MIKLITIPSDSPLIERNRETTIIAIFDNFYSFLKGFGVFGNNFFLAEYFFLNVSKFQLVIGLLISINKSLVWHTIFSGFGIHESQGGFVDYHLVLLTREIRKIFILHSVVEPLDTFSHIITLVKEMNLILKSWLS